MINSLTIDRDKAVDYANYHLNIVSDEIEVTRDDVSRIFVGTVKLTAANGAQEYRIRVTIRSNTYAEQSHARISVWDPRLLKWNFLHNLPANQMQTPHQLVYMSKNRHHAREFQRDFDALVHTAVQILF